MMANLSTLFPRYFPAMMKFDGSTGYYSKTGITFSGNILTIIVRFSRTSFTGNTFERVVWAQGNIGVRCAMTVFSSNHASFPNRLGKLQVDVLNNSGVNICKLISINSLIDGSPKTVMFTYDGSTGVTSFLINGVTADDTGNADRVAPSIATLSTVNGLFHVGASGALDSHFGGLISFVGYRDIGGLNWADFMHPDGTPKPLDETTWTEWGGQPLFWHEAAKMDENLGSAGPMTKNGTITLASAQTT